MVERTVLVVSQRPLELGGGGTARWRHLRSALGGRGWRVVECSGRVGLGGDESSTDPRAAVRAARRARMMAIVGRALDPVARLAGVTPVALAPNNVWALTGRRAVREAIRRERPEVIIATTPPPSALLATAAVAQGLPLVAEFRDLWAGNPYFDRGSGLLRKIQRHALARTAAIVTVSEGCSAVLQELDPSLGPRLHVLPNGFDPALVNRRSAPPGNQPRVLIHAGALYGDRTAVALISALGQKGFRGRVRLRLLGVIDPETHARLASTQADVTVESPVPWDAAIDCVLAADVAVVINSPGTGGDMALPGKLFEALALGRPVLALTPPTSDSALLLTRLGQEAGVAPPDDPGAIAAAIERLLDEPPPPVRQEALADFDRDRIAEGYAALLDEVATRSSSETSSGTTTSRR